MLYFCVVTIFFFKIPLIEICMCSCQLSAEPHDLWSLIADCSLSQMIEVFYCDTFTQWTRGLNEHFSFCFAFLRKKVMCIYVHMSAASHYGSSFVYLFLACSWSFLFELVCAGVCVKEDIGVGMHILYGVFSAVAGLPHAWSVGHWGCSSQPWPTCLFLFLRYCPSVGVKSGYSFCCQNTLMRDLRKCDMFGSRLLAQMMIVFEGKLPLLTERQRGRAGRRTGRGPALHPCHSLFSLYHLCDSDELWMRL